MESLEELAKSRLFDLTRRVEVIEGQSPSESTTGWPTLLVTPGDTVDNKYQIQALLGEGGMGAVFKARHLNLAKDVALKTFRMVEIDRSAWLRFKREVQAMARLAHPNIVQVFDFGITESNMPYYTMEYLQGESLAERTARGGNGRLNDTLRIFVEAAKALEAAHRKGVLLASISAGFLIMSQTHAPAKLQEKFSRPPYYQGLRNKEKVFKFPNGVDIGRIFWEDPDLPGTKPRKYKAEGELLLPTTGKLSLEISSDVRQHPEYMDGFRDNDLFRLNLKHARNEVMDHITQLSGLKTLVLVDSEIDDSKAAELGRLGGLVWLEAQRSKFTAHTYENLPYLSQLQGLHLSQVAGVNALIKRLQRCPNLTSLSLIDCQLQNSDIQAIDKLPRLTFLRISDNPAIDDQSMMQFRRARLASLDVDGTAVTPAAVPILKNIILANRPDGFVTVAGNKWDARAMAHAAKELGTPVKPPKVDKIF